MEGRRLQVGIALLYACHVKPNSSKCQCVTTVTTVCFCTAGDHIDQASALQNQKAVSAYRYWLLALQSSIVLLNFPLTYIFITYFPASNGEK